MAKPVPFFRLPRELRDRIYAELGGQDEKCSIRMPFEEQHDNGSLPVPTSTPMIASATLTHKPTKHLRLVSREFKHEYETEICRHSTLSVWDLHAERWTFWDRETEDRDHVSPGHQSFRSVQKLELRLRDYQNYQKDPNKVIEDHEKVIGAFLPYMDCLKRVDCMFLFHVPMNTNEHDISAPALLKIVLAGHGSLLSDKNIAVPVRSHIYLKSHLYSVSKEFPDDIAELMRSKFFDVEEPEVDIADYVEGHELNSITYRATPSADDDQFWGLDLAIHKPVANIDFDGLVRDAEKKCEDEQRALWLSRVRSLTGLQP